MNRIIRFIDDEQGADLIEYALLVGLIALALTTTLTNVQSSIKKMFEAIGTKVDDATKTVSGTTGTTTP
jgi:Flp pilus assembly pilin Flp